MQHVIPFMITTSVSHYGSECNSCSLRRGPVIFTNTVNPFTGLLCLWCVVAEADRLAEQYSQYGYIGTFNTFSLFRFIVSFRHRHEADAFAVRVNTAYTRDTDKFIWAFGFVHSLLDLPAAIKHIADATHEPFPGMIGAYGVISDTAQRLTNAHTDSPFYLVAPTELAAASDPVRGRSHRYTFTPFVDRQEPRRTAATRRE